MEPVKCGRAESCDVSGREMFGGHVDHSLMEVVIAVAEVQPRGF
jgi:hypothetical protein